MEKNYLTLFFLPLLIFACNKTDESTLLALDKSEVTLTIGLPETISKASLVESAEQMNSIGVYCAHTLSEPWSTTSEFSKMSNKQLTYNTISGTWEYVGEIPTWGNSTVTDKYTFYAYSPYSADEDEDDTVSSSIVNGELVVKYTTAEECSDQVDLMIAKPRKNIYPQVGGSVQLDFVHALSTIAFCVKGESTNKITSIAIKGVTSSGEVSINDDNEVTWKNLSEPSSLSYNALIDSNAEANTYSSTTLTLEDGFLMMIPQSTDNIEVIAEVYNSESKESSERSFSLSGFTEWQAGEIYTYTINLGSYDYTIEGTSNCYMLHPDNHEQIFYIPIEGRINTFWRDYAGEEAIEDLLSSSDEWTTSILWHDIQGEIQGFSAERVTSGFSPSENITPFSTPDFTTEGCRSAMKVTLPATITEGNILVGVEFNDQILWSWHFWITSYDPDSLADICRSRTVNNKYVFSIGSLEGEVHRLDNSNLWSGIYDQKFMMDRNLGARDCNYASDQLGILHYQYARKDPFPYTFTPTIEETRVTFAHAVRNPTTFYTQTKPPYSWSDEGLINTDKYLWGDVNVDNDPNKTGKSIFDPSPLGWKVPRNGVFEVLDDSNCTYEQSDNILVYNKEIFFPMSGFRSNNSGESSSCDAQGNLRTSTALDDSFAYNLVYNPQIDKSRNNTRADGFCIRCIEE